MTRITHFVIAAFFAAIVGVVSLAPARATSVPAGAIVSLDQAGKATAENARYYRRRPVYRRRYVRPRRVYRPYYYRPRPVYRRCWNRPRVVWTPYGYVRRWVRVCR
jgi:hypothetical protein